MLFGTFKYINYQGERVSIAVRGVDNPITATRVLSELLQAPVSWFPA